LLRKSKQWVLVEKFETEKEGRGTPFQMAFDLAEKGLLHNDRTPFKKQKKSEAVEYSVQEYYCGARAKYGCVFQTKVVVQKDLSEAVVFKCGEHSHIYAAVYQHNARGIPLHIQEFVRGLLGENKHIKPKTIQQKIRDAGLEPLPDDRQIYNFLTKVRQQLFSEFESEDFSNLANWVSKNQYKESLADDAMFVLPGAILPEELDWAAVDNIRVVVVVSTRALLRNAILQAENSMPSVQLSDGTYNLLQNGWPTLVLGTIDWDHRLNKLLYATNVLCMPYC
jgi:hypothetical protein